MNEGGGIDGFMQRAMQWAARKEERVLTALRAHELPESLEAVINEHESDFGRNVFDLLTLQPEVQQLFFGLEGLFVPYRDILIRTVKAYQSLDSAQKVKSFILAELLESKDPYGLIDQKFEMDGDGYTKLYKTLVEIANLEDFKGEKLKPILERISFFEEAALEIILDRNLYFTKTRIGNEGTASEFVGSMISIPMNNSPLVKEGRYVDRLMQAIQYQDIVEGKITKRDPQTFMYQSDLLNLLSIFETPGKPGNEYWHKLLKNPDFLDLLYIISNRRKDPIRDELLSLIIRRAYEASNGNLEKFEHQVNFDVGYRFHGETALDKFLADPANEYKTALNGNITRTDIRVPHSNAYLYEPKVLVLTDYAREGDTATVGYAEISSSIERKTAALDMRAMRAPGVPEDVGKALLNMATGFERFKSQYLAYLQQVKSGAVRHVG